MTKEEFLNKLSHEELLILRDMISSNDITKEIKSRNLKTPMEVKVGDCFIYRNDYGGDIFLTKVINCGPTDIQHFDCKEISIDDHDIDSYEITYFLDDFFEHDRINSEIFNKIEVLVNNRDNTIDKICKEFDKQIRELCSTLLNIQNNYVKKENK